MIATPISDLRSEDRIRLTDLFHFAEQENIPELHKFYSKPLKERLREMANRKGVFIGAYVPNHLKESLRRRAAAEHRTLSQEITRILEEAVHGKGLPAGSIDRRNRQSTPRRRSSDPAPRRRRVDVLFEPTGNKSGGED